MRNVDVYKNDELNIICLADFYPSKTIGSDEGYYWDNTFQFIDNFPKNEGKWIYRNESG